MARFLAWLVHRWRYEWVPAAEINAEAGSMDDYCTCWICRRAERRA